jgi:hypothetical protein
MASFSIFGVWSWFILGLALMIVEIIAPGTLIFWLGLSAILVGMLSLVIDWSWQVQFAVFAIFTVASIPIWRRFGRKLDESDDRSFLNRRSEALVGHVFTLETPIVDGAGTVRIDDTVWRVHGPDCASGIKVQVVAADGASLTVAPVSG